MPKMNFDEVPDATDFTPVPEGEYLARVVTVAKGITENNNEKWDIKLRIMGGEHEGRHVLDCLVFTERAYPRIKLVCKRLGIDVSGTVDLKPSDLEGRHAYITVEIEEFEGRDGKTKQSNKIPFAGYRSATEGQESEQANSESKDDDTPF
jgi:hypothetical protein